MPTRASESLNGLGYRVVVTRRWIYDTVMNSVLVTGLLPDIFIAVTLLLLVAPRCSSSELGAKCG